MGFWRRLGSAFRAPEPAPGPAARATFDSAPRPIDQLFMELYGRGENPRVGRTEALSVPAVQRGRNMICSVATLPLVQVGPDRSLVPNPLLDQIDPDIANVVTLAQTLEDLLFDAVSWWRVTGFGWDGYPVSARHLDVSSVSVDPPEGRTPAPLPSGLDPRQGGVVWVDGKPVGGNEIIRFDSPNPAVLVVGARAIRRAILLDKAAGIYAGDPRPLDYFTPAEGADEMSDDDAADFLAVWMAARKKRGTAWVPNSVKYNSVDAPSPQELQLAELQKQAALEIANALGVDPEDLGVSTTSRTYANAIDRRRDRINDVLSPFMRAITDRLSMGDVTKRGYRVLFDLDDYMKSNPTERWATYRTAKEIGVMDPEEIRAKEGLPAGAPKPEPTPAPEPVDEPTAEPAEAEPVPVDAARPPAFTFAAGHRFVDLPLETFRVDVEARTIEGIALPYGKQAGKYGGIRFEKGALKFGDVSRVKLLREHGEAIGVATKLTDSSSGFVTRFKVARGAAGDEALSLAEDGVLDGLSVGVDFDPAGDTIPDPRHKGGTLVRRADLREVSLTAMPAFDDARVTKVAASRSEGENMPESTPVVETAPAVVPGGLTLTAEQAMALLSSMYQVQNAQTAPTAPAVVEPAPEPRQVVNPSRPVATLSTTEPASYRFDRRGILMPAAHDFGVDIVQAAKSNNPNSPEYRRVMEFVRAQFDVVSTDVNELNPTINLPRYIDEREFQYPIWSAVNKGAPPNGIQGFTWPKFSTAANLVSGHTEGVEPASGTYVTTSQTVTPTPISGKAKISRETWDMGGTPGAGNLIWTRMMRDWFENLEAAIVTELNAASPTSLATFTAGGGTTGQTLVSQMRGALARLHFVRGGFRFDTAFAQTDLYSALVGALDGNGRPILPAIGPTNADGTVSDRYQSVNVNGIPFLPTWSLAASGTVAASSYLLDRTAVDGWATVPQRLDITTTEVANVYIGLWGYKATAINDINGVREIVYDPVA